MGQYSKQLSTAPGPDPGTVSPAARQRLGASIEKFPELRAQAVRCRRLAHLIGDQTTVEALLRLAEEYDARALAAPAP